MRSRKEIRNEMYEDLLQDVEIWNAMTALSLRVVTEACMSVTHRGHIINNAS